jgi:hypothetical protein
MSKTYVKIAGTWTEISATYIKVSGVWKETTASYIKVAGAWQEIVSATQYTTEWAVGYNQNYWESGAKDTSYPDEHIQGTYDGTTINRRRNLCIFDYSDIQSTLTDATIDSVLVYLERLDTVHGSSGAANVRMYEHTESTIPTTWAGTVGDAITTSTPTFLRGEGKWVTLTNAFGEALRDGTTYGIAFKTTSTNIIDYVRLDKTVTSLKITYTK